MDADNTLWQIARLDAKMAELAEDRREFLRQFAEEHGEHKVGDTLADQYGVRHRVFRVQRIEAGASHGGASIWLAYKGRFIRKDGTLGEQEGTYRVLHKAVKP